MKTCHHQMQERNIVHKYKTLSQKLNNLPDEEGSQILNQEYVTHIKMQWKLLEGILILKN